MVVRSPERVITQVKVLATTGAVEGRGHRSLPADVNRSGTGE